MRVEAGLRCCCCRSGSPATACRPPVPASRLDLPPLMLWAWDRDDDLRFHRCRATPASPYLAATLTLRGEDVVLTARHNPLTLPPGVRRVAVVHVETDRGRAAGAKQRAAAPLRRGARRGRRRGSASRAAGRLRGAGVAARLLDRCDRRAAPAPSRRRHLGHRARLLVLQRELDRAARCRRGRADAVSHGLRRPPAAGASRRRRRLPRRANAAPVSASRPTSCPPRCRRGRRVYVVQPAALDPRDLSDGTREDTPMVTRSAAPIDAGAPALRAAGRRLGDRRVHPGDPVLQPLRHGSREQSRLFPRPPRHPASDLRRQPALCRLPPDDGRQLHRCAGAAAAGAVL